MQAMAASGTLDFIKLDIEGAEKQLLDEQASRDTLCQARCLFMELHDRYAPGCTRSFQSFMKSGCAHTQPPYNAGFEWIMASGEYILVCQRGAKQPESWPGFTQHSSASQGASPSAQQTPGVSKALPNAQIAGQLRPGHG